MIFSELADISPKVKLSSGVEYPFVEMEDVEPGNRYVKAVKSRIFKGGGSKFGANDILFARITPCLENGKIAQFKGNDGTVGFGSTEFFIFRAKEGICDKGFLFYLAYSDILRKPAEGSMFGASGRQRAVLDVVKSTVVPDIPLNNQKKISAVLSAYDDLIENNTRRIQLLEEMAQRIYREWFVDYRFPKHGKVKFYNSEIGKIPEGWEVKRLSEIVETQYGYTESTSDKEIGPKFLRGMDINKNSYIDWHEVPYCKIPNEDYARYCLSRGDIVIIRMADPGKVGIVERDDIKAVFASYLIRLKIKTDISPYYLFYFLLSDRYQGYILGACTGTTRKSASAGVITDIDIQIPEKRVLDDFIHIIARNRALLNNLIQKNEKLRKSRNILLPKLISGELDVSELDIEIREQANDA